MNRNYKYGISSQQKIATVSPLLQEICDGAMKIANSRKLFCPDFGISCGKRTADEQFRLFSIGRYINDDGEYEVISDKSIVTICDGFELKSSHQSGNAIDFFAIIDGKASYDSQNLTLVATCFFEAACNIGYNIKWGGNYNSFIDGCHIELV